MKEEKIKDKNLKEKIRNGTKEANESIKIEENEEIKKYLNKIIVGDGFEVLTRLPSESVDIVITSPPYNFGHSYNNDQTNDTMKWEEYFKKLSDIWIECYRILKPGGRIIVNIQPLFSDYIPTHHIISNQLQDIGFLWKAESISPLKSTTLATTVPSRWHLPMKI